MAYPRRTRLAAMALLIACGGASAQDALGTGNALDANPRVGSLGINPAARSFAEEIRFRNALVTGNAAGARAFRGDIGYSAAADFRDTDSTVGSNDLFDFQRDAYYSGLATRNIRGIDAIKLQYSLATGAAPTASSAAMILQRSTTGATAEQARNPNTVTGVDPFTNRPGTLRSTSRWLTEVANEPVGIAQTEFRGELRYISASGLRGVFAEFPNRPAQEEAAPEEEAVFDPPARMAPDQISGLESGAREVERPDSRIESARVKYDEVLEALVRSGTRRAGDVEEAGEGEAEAPELRTPRIEPMPELEGEGEGEEAEGRPLTAREQFLQGLDDARRRLLGLETSEEEELEEAGERLGGYDATIDSFVAEGGQKAAYDRRMREGETALREGRFFDAEESFTRALTQRVGDPIASLGRVHAEIGAGLYLSAALNLETLLRAHPEFAALRTSPELLPSKSRLDAVLERLYEESGRNDMFGRQVGLVLAYLGHQLEQPDAVRTGLEAARRVDEHLARDPDPLLALLRGAWGVAQ